MERQAQHPSIEQIWQWLGEVPDPEIPVISVTDLGIVREMHWSDEREGAKLVVTITPTYSGCPATKVIADDIRSMLNRHGISNLELKTQISPPWTTDWISERGKKRLRDFGIAPPAGEAEKIASTKDNAPGQCPHCGSARVVKVSDFGSTPCKAQYKCEDCLEPFDYFKCI